MLKLDAKLAELGLQPGSVFKDSFIFYRSFADTLRNLPANYKTALFDALIDFALDMKEPDFSEDAVLSALWAGMAAQVEANWVRTLNGHKGKDYGVQGGAPAGNKNASKERTTPKQPQNSPKTTPNINANANVNVNVNVNDNANANANVATAGPAEADVISYCLGIGLTDAEAHRFYETLAAVGWVDKYGRKIKSWQVVADKWAKHKNDYPRRSAASRAEIPEGNHEADNSLFAKNDL